MFDYNNYYNRVVELVRMIERLNIYATAVKSDLFKPRQQKKNICSVFVDNAHLNKVLKFVLTINFM